MIERFIDQYPDSSGGSPKIEASYSPETITRKIFDEEVSKRLEDLSIRGVELDDGIVEQIASALEESCDPFKSIEFRLWACHLLNGMDAAMAIDDFGKEILGDRASALPANLQVAIGLSIEKENTGE